MSEITAGFAMCGSFCTFSKVLPQMRVLLEKGMHIVPIMSQAAYSIDTRFGKAADFRVEIEEMCGEKIIHTLFDAEPIGPKKLLDILIIEPCTGNTIGKLATGITDTPVGGEGASAQQPPCAYRRFNQRCIGSGREKYWPATQL